MGDKYTVYNSDGERERDRYDVKPDEGFYYAQDKIDGELTLYRVVGDHHIAIETWPSSYDVDYRVTGDGEAYASEGNGSQTIMVDPDDRQESEDIGLADLDELWGEYGYMDGLRPEGDVLEWVRLPIPRGASPDLAGLIVDTKDTMQEGFDSIGVGNPEAAPDFTSVLEDIGTAQGWTDIRNISSTTGEHETLTVRLDSRQELFDDKNNSVEIDVDDLTPRQVEILENLRRIKNDLAGTLEEKMDLLEYYAETEGYSISEDDDGNMVRNHSPAAASKTYTDVLYELVEDEGGSPRFELHPDIEQAIYVSAIITASEDFDSEYTKAEAEFQGIAGRIDDDNEDDTNNDDTNNDDTNNDDTNNDDTNNDDTNYDDTNYDDTNYDDTNNDGTNNDDPFEGEGVDGVEGLFDDVIGDTADDGVDGAGAEDGAEGADDSAEGAASRDQMFEDALGAWRSEYLGGQDGENSDNGDNGGNAVVPAANNNNGGGSTDPLGGLGSIIPSLLQSGMMGNSPNMGNSVPRLERDPRDDPRRFESPAVPEVVNTVPAGQQLPSVTAPGDVGVPPPVVTPAGGMVDVKLPDGSELKTSSVVAQAVNAELHNPNGSDPRAAYEGTAGQASSSSPWTQVSTPQTGDVVQWTDRSALVVNTDAGGLQMIVNGQVVPLDPHNPPEDGRGGFGDFVGFFHPSGIDSTSAVAATGVPGAPAAGAQVPNPPVVTAPSDTAPPVPEVPTPETQR
ncbi:hypothetical protein [Nocardia uniformis]|uniref:hypothetical protein n=1 Tax=Nocardia uniformis TaxID=53432 RepID=UPI000836A31B|nr:hypothetical protein [Nocardia uniformis]